MIQFLFRKMFGISNSHSLPWGVSDDLSNLVPMNAYIVQAVKADKTLSKTNPIAIYKESNNSNCIKTFKIWKYNLPMKN